MLWASPSFKSGIRATAALRCGWVAIHRVEKHGESIQDTGERHCAGNESKSSTDYFFTGRLLPLAPSGARPRSRHSQLDAARRKEGTAGG